MKFTPKKHRPFVFDSKKGHFKQLKHKGRVVTKTSKAKYKKHLWLTEKNYLQGDTRGYPWQEIAVWKHIPDELGGDYFWHMMIVFYRIKTNDNMYMIKIAMRKQRGYSAQTSIGTTTYHKTASVADKRISRIERSLYNWLKTHNHSKGWKPPKR